MPIPASWQGRLSVPVVASPMFLTSNPDLVVECCRAGIVGSFPALNQRTTEGFAEWLDEIESRLSACSNPAPYGVNLIVHRTNARLEADLAEVVKRKVPLIITSLGLRREVIETVHGYGGVVFHDVIDLKFARKAIDAKVDGLIAVAQGAGGHAGLLNPIAFLYELRRMFAGTVLLGGVTSTGSQIAAARMLGADMAYMGSRFLVTRESIAPDDQKQMMLDSRADDIVYTPKVSGIHGNFLRNSLTQYGIDLEDPAVRKDLNITTTGDIKPWRHLWAAGQGVGAIDDIPPAAELCRRLIDEYHAAIAGAPGLLNGLRAA